MTLFDNHLILLRSTRSSRNTSMLEDVQPKYRWYMLALLTATGTFVAAIGFSCMPVLFKEISDDLNLSLVQIGTVWGIASLAGIFVSIIGGVISDRFGMKPVLTVFCILVGITGSLRGFADSFFTLSATVFFNGFVRLIVPVTITKSVGIWFKGPKLGMAMGISAMGMGLGLMLGPMISASLLSPWLGGWRNVMHFYGALAVIVGLLWWIFGRERPDADTVGTGSVVLQLQQSFSKLVRLKAVWILGLTLLFRVACILGTTGYVPLYLREKGWPEASADGTLAAFYVISTLFVVPLSMLSDRLGSRKAILYPAVISATVGTAILPLVDGPAVWMLMILTGMFMDGFMATIVTMLLETEGVGPTYSGIALGMVFTIAHIGSVSSPPLGNSFASIDPGVPFFFWAGLSVVSLVFLFYVKETGWRKRETHPDLVEPSPLR